MAKIYYYLVLWDYASREYYAGMPKGQLILIAAYLRLVVQLDWANEPI